MTVRQVKLTSGPSLLKEYYEVYEEDTPTTKIIGQIFLPIKLQVGEHCSSYFIACRDGKMSIHSTLVSAITSGLNIHGNITIIDNILDQLFEIGYSY